MSDLRHALKEMPKPFGCAGTVLVAVGILAQMTQKSVLVSSERKDTGKGSVIPISVM